MKLDDEARVLVQATFPVKGKGNGSVIVWAEFTHEFLSDENGARAAFADLRKKAEQFAKSAPRKGSRTQV